MNKKYKFHWLQKWLQWLAQVLCRSDMRWVPFDWQVHTWRLRRRQTKQLFLRIWDITRAIQPTEKSVIKHKVYWEFDLFGENSYIPQKERWEYAQKCESERMKSKWENQNERMRKREKNYSHLFACEEEMLLRQIENQNWKSKVE
jgi:hypothetical protein